TKTLLSGVPHPKGSLHWLAFSQADRMTGTPVAPFKPWLPTKLYDSPIATTTLEKKDRHRRLTSVAPGKLPPSRLDRSLLTQHCDFWPAQLSRQGRSFIERPPPRFRPARLALRAC